MSAISCSKGQNSLLVSVFKCTAPKHNLYSSFTLESCSTIGSSFLCVSWSKMPKCTFFLFARLVTVECCKLELLLAELGERSGE